MRLIAVALLTLGVLAAQAPPAGPTPEHIAAMKKFDFLIGEWKGESWTQMGPKKEFAVGTETVRKELDGLLVVVNGDFKHKDTGLQVHKAYGVFSFNPRADWYNFFAFTSNGQIALAKVAMVDKGFDWSFEPSPGILIKYKMRIDEKGDWVEKGEMTREEKTVQFFEMRLQKMK
jgi:hypothetical protein